MSQTRNRSIAPAVLLLAASLPFSGAEAQEWTRFRGPNGAGHGKGEAIPARFAEADYNWKVKLPGSGHGSPVLWGEKIFLMCANEATATRLVVCLSAADGRVLWSRPYRSKRSEMNGLNSYGATTPAVDADRLYVCWTDADNIVLRALDHDGKDLWDRGFGPHRSEHGPCTSPMLVGDAVILTNDQQGKSFLTAVEAATGKTRWQAPRPADRAAYSTPCVRRPKGGQPELIVTSTAAGVVAIHPESGQVIWEAPDACPARCVSSPVLADDLVVTTSGVGSRGRLVAVRPTDGGNARRAYEFSKNGPYVPTPLAVGERLFLFGDAGALTCLNARTGEQLWQEKVDAKFFGSPVLVGGRIYCIDRGGTLFVIAAADKFELLAKNPLGGLGNIAGLQPVGSIESAVIQ